MISAGDGFVVRHRSGRYLDIRVHFVTMKRIDGSDSGCHDPFHPSATIYNLVARPLDALLLGSADHWNRYLDDHPDWRSVADEFEVVPGPVCGCCGERFAYMRMSSIGACRCATHDKRNVCAIEGCKRTTAAKGEFVDDQYLCPEHWRRFVPPRSATRRAYHRFFRIAKKTDWTPELRRRFHRFWDGLVKRARRQSAEGRLDMTEINQMFGWGE